MININDMQSTSVNNIDKDLAQDVTDFLNMHLVTQLNCKQLSQQFNLIGYPGFAWFFEVQANDEFLHTRRCENFLQNTVGAEDYQIVAPNFKPFKIKTVQEGLEFYINMREKTLNVAIELRAKAADKKNWLVANFYSWFIKDYWSEIEYNKDVLDRANMPNADLTLLDRKANKKPEINPENIIHPMKGFVMD